MADPRYWTPNEKSQLVLDAATIVIESARSDGYRFTLRRVYYELVSRNIIPNKESSYRSLSALLNNARWAGYIPMTALDDLGRVVQIPTTWESPSEILTATANGYQTDLWRNATRRVEVWAEKAAVQSIVQPVADQYGVPFLTMRGYSSLTAIAEANERCDRNTTVIYVGDHDPSGQDMDRDLQDRLNMIGAWATLERVALTRQQIDQYQLPPQPTKGTDPRARGYSDDESWELDALPANVLSQIVEDRIRNYLPDDYDDLAEQDEDARTEMRRFAERWSAENAP